MIYEHTDIAFFGVLSAQKVPLSLRQKPTECKNNFSTQSLLKAAR